MGASASPRILGLPRCAGAAEHSRPWPETVLRTRTAAAARGPEANVRCEAEMFSSPRMAAGSHDAVLICSVHAGRALSHHGLAVVRALTVGILSLFKTWGRQLCHEAALAARAVAAIECMPRPPSETLR